ncbi:MAG: crtM [Anaerophaga sp.]|uniref:phytoene/squalene synthase family protein n=1 Tax=Anaerophaga thermohalophila TaxID=177400 RepID=UPI000237BADC|nr:phytoene/squalene synthase family protein [Anaerophaga thermohalophila]MBZ4676433.1 crtM [Anaerophaga sp.]MDI3521368.1 15-cis-phytoene synthase [Anaerophaga sp.]
MKSIDLYNINALSCSRNTTKHYSTSFSLGIKLLAPEIREAVYSIYGFVRFADEIVDTFHNHDKAKLLENYRKDTYLAIKEGISANPILHSFQRVANKYQIDHELIDAFFTSMSMDLNQKEYDHQNFKTYIYGSAEVVGLMCLKVFYKDDPEGYEALKYPARKLGEAFQKVNFLRDVQADLKERGRTYFPNVDLLNFTITEKEKIEKEIEEDFRAAYKGIVKLKKEARLGVYVAYVYYLKLFQKIKKMQPAAIMRERIRINNWVKMGLLFQGLVKHETGRV